VSAKRQRYAPHGTLALAPRAFGLVFDLEDGIDDAASCEFEEGGIAVIDVRGPLMHHSEWFFDSYDAIKHRVHEALERSPTAIVLSIDSPGGLVSGAFDTARELRMMTEEAGVELVAHVAGQATSAAYALATAATRINVSESAMLGSIGVIDTLVDVTAQNASFGINVALVTSGARKSDGNPSIEITEEALAATQERVDDLAEMFFALVVEHGWASSVDELRALDAGIVHGADAVRIGLATEIATLDETVGFIRSGVARSSASEAQATERMETMKEDAIAALRKMAEGDDEEEAKLARAALAAMGEEDPPEGDDDKPEGDDDKPDEDDDKPEAKAAEDDPGEPGERGEDDKSASAMALRALAEVHNLKAGIKAEKIDAERSSLLASRPDFAPELVDVLRSAPMAMVRKTCKTLKRGPARADRVAAAATATATVRGEGQGGDNAPRLSMEEKSALDLAMGLSEMSSETVHTSNRMSFGVHRPASTKGK